MKKDKTELLPGQWMKPEEYAEVVRLTPLVAMDLIVRSPEGRVLVGRRTNEPAKGVFFVPGSRVTKNESLAAAFKRITQEELGVALTLEQARFRGVYEHFYPTNRLEVPGFGTHYIVLAYEINAIINSQALPNDQHGEFVWMTPADLLASPSVHQNTKAYFR